MLARTKCLYYVALNIKWHGDLHLSLLKNWFGKVDMASFLCITIDS